MQAIENRTIIETIKNKLMAGTITYAEAVEEIKPVVNKINDKAIELAKKYGMKPQLVNARSILR